MITSPMAMLTQVAANAGGIVEAGSGWSSGTSWLVANVAVAVLIGFAKWASRGSLRRR